MLERKLRGFSLIEVIVASALIATTVGALFALAAMSLRVTATNQDRIIAAQLVRESLEAVRQIRDGNYVSSSCPTSAPCVDWRTNILDEAEVAQAKSAYLKRVDLSSSRGFVLVPVAIGSDTKCSDYYNRFVESGRYTITTNPETSAQIYCRRLFVEPIGLENAPDDTKNYAIRVRSQVIWATSIGQESFPVIDEDKLNCDEATKKTNFWCSEQVTILTNWRESI